MKAIAVIVCVFVFGCSNSSTNKIKNFIPGTYVKRINTEFSNGIDTLIVEKISDAGNNYRIKRHSGYQRIWNGKLLAREIKSEDWMAIYNDDEKILREIKHGKIISFDPDNSIMYVGTVSYTKLRE